MNALCRVLSIAGIVVAAAGLATYPMAAAATSAAEGLTLRPGPQASVVFDRNDRPVFTFFRERRTDVTLDRVSPHVIAALLAIEDRRFFVHHGVDVIRVFGAAWVDLRARKLVEGASSITQQLVRLDALTPERTLRRKFTEMLLALAVERRFSKDEILQAYLNRVYFGDGYYGIEAAARGYFGKPAADLSIPEAAALAGVVKSPTKYALRSAPDRAIVRRNLVIRAMRAAGVIAADQAQELENASLTVVPRGHDELAEGEVPSDGDAYCGLYFKEEVRRLMMKRVGADALYQGGLRIYTTFAPDLQRAAEDAVAARIRAVEATNAYQRRGHTEPLEAALTAIDPTTGYVLALVGGRDYHDSRFNRATQAHRQPGSAFKPLFFAAALEQGYSPGTVIDNLTDPIAAPRGPWLPKDEHGSAESYTMRRALAVSSNRAAAQLMQTIGVASAIDYARRLGIESSLAAVPSLAIGTAEVTLLELTSAYSAFAHDGLVATPTLVRRVEDRQGEVLWQTRVSPRRAVSPETAFLVSSMLSDVIQRGTGSQARALGFKLPAAGKTGTTDDFRDVWFVGYTPHLVAGVWFGFDTPSRIMNEGFAATVAVPAWATFMKQATAADKPDAFRVPQDVQRVTLCRRSGQLATDDCRWTIEMRPEEPAPTTTIPAPTTIPNPTTAGSLRLSPLPPPPGPPPQPKLVPVRVPYPNAVYEEYIRPGTVGPCTLHGPLAGAMGEISR